MVEYILIQGLTFCGPHSRFRRNQKYAKKNLSFFFFSFVCLLIFIHKRDGKRAIIT